MARTGPLQMGYAAQQRCLSRATRADDRYLLPRGHGERDIMQDLDLSKPLRDAADLDEWRQASRLGHGSGEHRGEVLGLMRIRADDVAGGVAVHADAQILVRR